jgi:hypothetical protein
VVAEITSSGIVPEVPISSSERSFRDGGALMRIAQTLRPMTALGLTPSAREKLGATLVQVDLATAMSERDPKRCKKLLEQAGVDRG